MTAAGETGDIVVDDGCHLHYRFDGPREAPPLLLSNSLGTSLAMWDAQIAAFAERFRVLRYDSRGHGLSDAPPGEYTIERLGNDVLALLDGLKIERTHVCGLSKGGMVGQWLGTNAQLRLRRLVLCNTAAIMRPRQAWDDRIALVQSRGMGAVVDAVVERWFTAGFRASQREAVDRIRAMIEATSPVGYAGCCAAVRDMDQRAGLPAITAPTLVIVGTSDPATPPAEGEFIAAAVPGARLAALDAAHLSNVEQPEAFTQNVLDFLRSEH